MPPSLLNRRRNAGAENHNVANNSARPTSPTGNPIAKPKFTLSPFGIGTAGGVLDGVGASSNTHLNPFP